DRRGEASVRRGERLAAGGAGQLRRLPRRERRLRAERPGAAELERLLPGPIDGRPAVRDAEEGDAAGPEKLEVRADDGQPPLTEEVLAEPERHRDVEAPEELGRERE